MMTFKRKSFRVFKPISKQKWIFLIVTTIILIVVCFIIQDIKYEYPLLYDLSVGYISSYIFYMLVTFSPDFLESIEKQNKIIPFRATIHRQVEQFINNLIYLWTKIGINAFYKGGFNISEITTINDFFKSNNIQEITKYIKLEEPIGDYIDVDVTCPHYVWSIKIRSHLDSMYTLGNLILTRYKNDIPIEIFYDIFYILNESQIGGELLFQLKAIASLKHGRNFSLLECINFEDNNVKENIKQSCQSIINLYNWVNEEYDYIASNTKDNHLKINKIDIQNFLKNEI